MTRRHMMWERHRFAIATVFDAAKAQPDTANWATVCHLARLGQDTVEELARVETRAERAEADQTAMRAVLRYLAVTRTGLSVTPEKGVCVTEQDGTTLHCAPDIAVLSTWVATQNIEQNAPTGGFTDHMAREWIT
jgi:hypothetical protein